MGSIAQFGLSQLSPDKQAALVQQTAPAPAPAPPPQPGTTVLPPTTGQGSDISSSYPSAYPLGSTADLENRAAQGPQQVAQSFQQQQPQQPQQQTGYSPDNPHAKMVNYYQQQLQALQPQAQGGAIKQLLTNFIGGMGAGMMKEAGLITPDEKRQMYAHNVATYSQLADGWEQAQNMNRYRSALTDQMQQNTAYQRQMQPLELQRAQLGLEQERQQIPTVPISYTKNQLVAQGIPADLAARYDGKTLDQADEAALAQSRAAYQATNKLESLDYGTDGTGPNKGRWWVNSVTKQPISQYSSTSESGSALALQKQQFAQQNALLKGMRSPVYAYDPVSKQTVLTTQSEAQQGGMQAIRGVKESDISKDTHDTRVLNDVAAKANNVTDYAGAMDSWNPSEKQAVANILSSTGKDANLEIGAFGTRFPTASINAMINGESWHALGPQARNYVTAVLSLREASMGLQRVLTGTARANESQINALQATLPGYEISGDIVRQKLGAFTQNIDMLRQGIPRIPGMDVVPVKKWGGPQSSAGQSIQQPQPQTGAFSPQQLRLLQAIGFR